jgi:hypothetical protein
MTDKEILVIAKLEGWPVTSSTTVKRYRRCQYHNSRRNRKRKDWHSGEEKPVMRLSVEGNTIYVIPVCEKHFPFYYHPRFIVL